MGHTSCKSCIDLLVDYLEGQLPSDKEQALDEHFMACPPCLDFLDQYRASSRLCRRALEEAEMPAAVADKLSEFLAKTCK